MQGSSQPPMQKNQEQSHNQRAASTSTQPQQESNQSERKNETKGKEKVANRKSNLPRKRKPNASGAKKTSIAWEHFEKLPDVKEPTTACKHCGRRYLCDPKQNGTSNMLLHITKCPKYPYAVTQDPTQSVINFSTKQDGVRNDMVVVSQKFNNEEFTVDNASSNDVAISYLKKRIKSLNGLVLDGELLHVRCCAHILNLIVNDGLKDMQDSIFSIRNVVRFVRSSPSRLAKFNDCVNFASLPSKGFVCIDVPTRWNSTYLMLEAALRFQAAFEKLEDDDRSYVEHFGVLGPPSASDWLNANVFLKFLKIFYNVTLILSGTLHITANSAFHQLALILIELNTWCVANDSLLRGMAMEMKKKYDKYWGNVQNINLIIYFGVIFDPRYKIKFIEWAFEKMYSDDVLTRHDMYIRIKNMLSKLYSWYSMAYEQGKESTQESSSQGSQKLARSDSGQGQPQLKGTRSEIETQTQTQPMVVD
ncbi:hypothetical protein L6164_037739 [Bauhinia variegata]|uniref:Uncharacterized protein n=1 Tax=Bauhinia variegata TaxID=167791 RepID=A0ACB9KKW6_BAUVA|nr:hypothetical protein L6164_037739 [Bauhinia variegata]